MTGSANSVYLADDDNVIAAYFNLGNDGISTTDTLYGVVKKAYKGTESNGSDTVVYLDLVTADGIKTVETEETNVNSFSKGMIVSFTGTYEKANDDIEIVSDNAKNQNTVTGKPAESQGYIAISNDWSDSSKLIRPYAGLYNGFKSVDVASAKVVSDSTVIYIDEDGYVVDEGTPSKAEELSNANGYYANAFVIVNSDNEIDLLVYETSNRIKDGKNEEVQLTKKPTATTLAAGTTDAQLKDLADGVYNPIDNTFAKKNDGSNDMAGKPSDNVIIKFTTKTENTKTTLTIKSGNTSVYNEEITGGLAVGGHYFYLNKFDTTVSSGRLTTAMVAGQTYSYTITEGADTIASGYFTA